MGHIFGRKACLKHECIYFEVIFYTQFSRFLFCCFLCYYLYCYCYITEAVCLSKVRNPIYFSSAIRLMLLNSIAFFCFEMQQNIIKKKTGSQDAFFFLN